MASGSLWRSTQWQPRSSGQSPANFVRCSHGASAARGTVPVALLFFCLASCRLLAQNAFVGSAPCSSWRYAQFAGLLQPRRSENVACPRTCAASETRLYDALGVSKDATVSEIKKAYYREAKQVHPDMYPNDESKLSRFQLVAEAYSTLADPLRRLQYDLSGLAGLAYFRTNATKLFGPPPWRVLIGKTRHWLWAEERAEDMLELLVSAIPNGISGVTVDTIRASYKEAYETDVAVLLERVSEEQATDTAMKLEDYGLAVKAEPIEGERSNEKESPKDHLRRIQRELGEASENLRTSAAELKPGESAKNQDADFDKWIDMVRSLRSELRAAAQELEEFQLQQVE